MGTECASDIGTDRDSNERSQLQDSGTSGRRRNTEKWSGGLRPPCT